MRFVRSVIRGKISPRSVTDRGEILLEFGQASSGPQPRASLHSIPGPDSEEALAFPMVGNRASDWKSHGALAPWNFLATHRSRLRGSISVFGSSGPGRGREVARGHSPVQFSIRSPGPTARKHWRFPMVGDRAQGWKSCGALAPWNSTATPSAPAARKL